MRFAARWLNTVLGVIVFALAVYRAATLSLTVDEADTYVRYVQHGWNGIFHGPFDANNHILYSILEKFSRQWFGSSELSLRAPSLLGAALYLWSAARLCALLVPGLWFSALAFLMVTVNPLNLDFMVAARGYGLALGLLAFSLLQLIKWVDDSRPVRIPAASIALGLSASANLVFVFPSIASFTVAVLFLLERQRFKLIPLAVLPAVLIPVALWWEPFKSYDPVAFYFGAATIYAAVELIEVSVFVHDAGRGDPFGSWQTLNVLHSGILPVLVPALWISAGFWIRRRGTRGLAFLALIFAITCFGYWLAHAWLGVLYPQERTGLAVIFLFMLTWVASVGEWWRANRFTRWFLAFPSLLLTLVFLVQFAGQFDARYFGSWRVNWKMKEAMSQLRGSHGRIRTHWIYQATAEYYRLRLKLAFEPIVREADQFDLDNADYFIVPLTPEQIGAAGMQVIYRDDVTGTTVLKSSSRRLER